MESTTRDILVKGGTIMDGMGGPGYISDLAIRGDRIAALEKNLPVSPGARVIDATGLIVAPGFIDMHSHSDLTLFVVGGIYENARQ